MSSQIKTTLSEYQDKEWAQLAEFQLKKNSKDPRFGEINIYMHKNNNSVIFSKEH